MKYKIQFQTKHATYGWVDDNKSFDDSALAEEYKTECDARWPNYAHRVVPIFTDQHIVAHRRNLKSGKVSDWSILSRPDETTIEEAQDRINRYKDEFDEHEEFAIFQRIQ
jgi:hypothetical protein